MSLILHEYVVEKLQKILPYEFTTKEEVVKLLKIELAKIKIFDVEELTFAELITAVCVSKGLSEKEVLDTEFTKYSKIFSIFQQISYPDIEISKNYVDISLKRYLFDSIETKIKNKYEASWFQNLQKIIFKKDDISVLTLVRPFIIDGKIIFEKVFFNLIKSEDDYFGLMPEEFLKTKNPKFITSTDSNKAYLAQCQFVLLEELEWIIDNIEFKFINNSKDAKIRKMAKGK